MTTAPLKTHFSHFELKNGREPNSEWTIMTDNLKKKNRFRLAELSQGRHESEERQEVCDSRPRVKIFGQG